MKITNYPPVIRVRRPKLYRVDAQASANPGPVQRKPFGSDVQRQVLAEFVAAKRLRK